MNNADLQAILAANVFPRREPIPVDSPLDFTRDGWFDNVDLQALLATYPTFGSPPVGRSWLQQINVPRAEQAAAMILSEAVFDDDFDQESGSAETPPGAMDWLDEAQRPDGQGGPSRTQTPVEEVIDKLLATYGR